MAATTTSLPMRAAGRRLETGEWRSGSQLQVDIFPPPHRLLTSHIIRDLKRGNFIKTANRKIYGSKSGF